MSHYLEFTHPGNDLHFHILDVCPEVVVGDIIGAREPAWRQFRCCFCGRVELELAFVGV